MVMKLKLRYHTSYRLRRQDIENNWNERTKRTWIWREADDEENKKIITKNKKQKTKNKTWKERWKVDQNKEKVSKIKIDEQKE